MKPRYIVERWPRGWLICGPGGTVPFSALSEVQKLFPKTAVMDLGIPHHFKASGRSDVVMCVVDAGAERNAWRTEILASLAGLPADERWWRGLDVGSSSAAVFAALVERPHLRLAASEFAKGAAPADADDFGRCERLLKLFPQWRARLPEVAAAYPETKWPSIVARWDELEAAPVGARSKLLREILDSK
jgi:hypothetical protein